MQLQFELVLYDFTLRQVSHNATGTWMKKMKKARKNEKSGEIKNEKSGEIKKRKYRLKTEK